MRIGIGLTAAVPGADMTRVGEWAARAEGAGFEAVGVIDRLVYGNLDPLTALAAAAVRTTRVELMTTVLNVVWRGNAVLLAKQLESVDRLSGGRLTAGLGMGGWPEDYRASGVPMKGRGERYQAMLESLGSQRILLAGTVPAAIERAAKAPSQGWVAPLFGLDLLREGAEAVAKAWADEGREGEPRIVTGRYFCLTENPDEYIEHYYGREYFDAARADTLTTPEQIRAELQRLEQAGCTDLLLYPCTDDTNEIERLAKVVRTGAAS